MKKIISFLFFILFIILFSINMVKVNSASTYDDFFFIVTTPSENTSNAMRVNWHTHIDGSVLEYTKANDINFENAITINPVQIEWDINDQPNRDVNDSFCNTRYVCSLEIDNLDARCKYIYRIKGNSKYSDVYHFTTSGLTNSWNFLAFVDFQNRFNKVSHDLVSKMLEIGNNPSLVVCSGDLTDCGGHEDEWQWVLNNKVFTNFIFASTNGDHEYMTTDTSPIKYFSTPYAFNNIFNNPKNGASGVENSNYYFYYNNVLFVYLDMCDSNTSTGDRFTVQEKWFDETMAKLNGTYQYSVVIAHKSIYGSTGIDTGVRKYITPKWYPLFDKYNVDLFIGGHDHIYSRTYPLYYNSKNDLGTYYLDMGSSGNKFRTPTDDLYDDGLHEKVIDLKTEKYACGANITVNEDVMRVDVYNNYGDIVDSFTINHKRNPLTFDYSGFNKDALNDKFALALKDDKGNGTLHFNYDDNLKYVKHMQIIRGDSSIIYDNDISVINVNEIELDNLKGLNYLIKITSLDGTIYDYNIIADVGNFTNIRLYSGDDGTFLRFTNGVYELVELKYDLYLDGNFVRTISKEEIENNQINIGNDPMIGNHVVTIKVNYNGDVLSEVDYNSIGYGELVLNTSADLTLKKGDEVILDYEFANEDLISIKSTNSKVVTIENGKIVAKGGGKAKIIIEIIDSNYQYEINCTVKSSTLVYVIVSLSIVSVGVSALVIVKKKRKMKEE